MKSSAKPFLEVGIIVGTHGLRGDLKIRPLPTGDIALKDAEQVFIRAGAEHFIPHQIVRTAWHKKHFLLRLDGLQSVEAVRSFVGQSLWMSRESLPDLAESHYYWHQLEGLEVVDCQYGTLGYVAGMFSTAAHDILEIVTPDSEILIPAVAEFIVKLDEQNGQLIVQLPEGLVPKDDLKP